MPAEQQTPTSTLQGVLPAGYTCTFDVQSRLLHFKRDEIVQRSIYFMPLQSIVVEALLEKYPDPCDTSDLQRALFWQTGCHHEKSVHMVLNECRALLRPACIGISTNAGLHWLCHANAEMIDE